MIYSCFFVLVATFYGLSELFVVRNQGKLMCFKKLFSREMLILLTHSQMMFETSKIYLFFLSSYFSMIWLFAVNIYNEFSLL